jgi:hypothetical protein
MASFRPASNEKTFEDLVKEAAKLEKRGDPKFRSWIEPAEVAEHPLWIVYYGPRFGNYEPGMARTGIVLLVNQIVGRTSVSDADIKGHEA